ncbi:uncharacterized protein LOC144359838 [Saccoglossus kowalevskii]
MGKIRTYLRITCFLMIATTLVTYVKNRYNFSHEQIRFIEVGTNKVLHKMSKTDAILPNTSESKIVDTARASQLAEEQYYDNSDVLENTELTYVETRNQNEHTYNVTLLLQTAEHIKKQNGIVTIQLLNNDYLQLTKNWICNIDCLLFASQVMFIVTDAEAYQGLKGWRPELNVVLVEYDTPRGMTYGKAVYYKFMSFRTHIIDLLLQNGISVFLCEADATWFGNPLLDIYKFNGKDVISIVNDDTFNVRILNGGFLFLNSTAATKTAWRMLRNIHRDNLSTVNDNEKISTKLGSEQNVFSHIVKDMNVNVGWLSTHRFVTGEWYSSENYILRKTTPIVILNNFNKGISAKVKRAKTRGYWFIGKDDKTCTTCPVLSSENGAD